MEAETRPDPKPDALAGSNLSPQAVPLLSYEGLDGHTAAIWVLRYIGMWVVLMGADPLLTDLSTRLSWWLGGQRLQWAAYQVVELLRGAALILGGVAITQRRVHGFWCVWVSLVVFPVATMIALAASAGPWIYGITRLPYFLVTHGSVLAVSLSMYKWATARGLLSARRQQHRPSYTTGSTAFLISRLGWIYLASACLLPANILMGWVLTYWGLEVVPWSWFSTAFLILSLLVGACGLLMCRSRVWPIWFPVAILPLESCGIIWTQWDYYFGRGFWREDIRLAPLIFGMIATTIMLCVLGCKATKEQRLSPSVSTAPEPTNGEP